MLFLIISCQKEFLSMKSDKALLIPSTLEDFQAILDGVRPMNENFPGIANIASDDFFMRNEGIISMTQAEKASYTWDLEVLRDLPSDNNWNYQYTKIFNANIVLDGLTKMKNTNNQNEINRIKGSALFYRAYAYYSLAEVFCEPYTKGGNNENSKGLFIRLESDVNQVVPLSTLSELYNQIFKDLEEAESLLPMKSLYKNRPNKRVVWAFLSRISLAISDFENAKLYADKCLAVDDELLNYNFIDSTLQNPFPIPLPDGNKEVIFYSIAVNYRFFVSALVGVDTLLYKSYEKDDLRKSLFFTQNEINTYSFIGNYSGDNSTFTGLANDEILLVRAECLAREGNSFKALIDLNYLLENRYNDKFNPIKIENPKEVLDRVLLERRKQLVGRGLRWADLRRLHRETEYPKNLIRNIDGVIYQLSHDQQPFIFPIPIAEKKIK